MGSFEILPAPPLTRRQVDTLVHDLRRASAVTSAAACREQLLGCLHDLAGVQPAALPELAFRLALHRLGGPPAGTAGTGFAGHSPQPHGEDGCRSGGMATVVA